MAKFEAVHQINHNGKIFEAGEGVDLDPKRDKQLIESGAVKETGPIRVISKKEE